MELPLIYAGVRAALAGRAAGTVQSKCSGNRELASGLENKAGLKGGIYTHSRWVWELVTGPVFYMVLWLFLPSELGWDPASRFAVGNRPLWKSSLLFRCGDVVPKKLAARGLTPQRVKEL